MRRLPLPMVLLPLALAAAAAGCGGVSAAVAKDLGPAERRSIPPGPTRLQLHFDAGEVTIVGAAGRTVALQRRATDDARLSEEVRGDTLHVQAHCPGGMGHRGCRAEYRLDVPRSFAVTVTGDAADVRLRDLAGALEVRSEAGDVRVEGAGGLARLATEAGDVHATGLRGAQVAASTDAGTVRLGFERAPELVSASTDAGDVDVALPAGPDVYDVAATTDVGDVDVDVPTGRGTGHRVEARTASGSVRVHR
jgi:hypothetical protein